jgi:hypothetical protein
MIANKEYHGIEVLDSLPEHIVDWLNERIGESRWFVKGGFGSRIVYFENEKDHMLFLLTWGRHDE